MMLSREVHLVRRPEGTLRPEDLTIVEREVADPAEGEVLIRNLLLSVPPAMNPRMIAGETMAGGAIGRIEKSRNPSFREGDLVSHRFGFREAFVSDGKGLAPIRPDTDLPLAVHLHALSESSGFIAYGGILHIAQLKEGEQVFVSSAAGSVGSIAAQIAKIKGCYVVGSTGSDEKVRWLKTEAGLDDAFNYKSTPVRAQLKTLMPRGIDVYFDNVGGDHLDGALAQMNVLGRVAISGMISGYSEPGGRTVVRNLSNSIYRRVTLRGFTVADFIHLKDQFESDMTGWLRDGRIKYRETIYDGIAKAPAAIIDLMGGANLGKMLIRLAH
jgi:NADPH-dependent curcumin reductase CurA